jgi:hypothetical protein
VARYALPFPGKVRFVEFIDGIVRDFRSGSITSFRAGNVDFRFTLSTGRFSASQRTVETGHKRTFVLGTEHLSPEEEGVWP